MSSDKNNNTKNETDDDIKNFIKFMKARAVFKDKNTGEYPALVTHTLMGVLHKTEHPYRGSFSIQGKEYNKFLKLYKNVMDKIPLFIVERLKETGKMVSPLIIDIDYHIENEERVYDLNLIKEVTKVCNEILLEYIDINKNDLLAYVQEKEEPTADKKDYKDGFHVFYDIPLSYNKRKFLFDKIKQEITQKELFCDIDTSSSYSEIVDEKVLIDNGFLMFGSTKEGRNPYKLTHIFSHNLEEIPINEYDDEQLIAIFSLQKYIDDDDIEFCEEYKEEEEKINNMEMHIKKKDKQKITKQEFDNNIKKQNCDNKKEDKKEDINTNKELNELIESSQEFMLVYKLINIMSKERATKYDTWTRVGWALNGISPKLYPLFLHFSRKAPNYDENGCDKLWSSANRIKAGLTVASVKMWAKEDNPVEYENILNERILKIIEKIDTPNDNDIADFINELYGDLYKCINITKNTWYEFQMHRWVVVDSGYTLLEKIATTVAEEFTKCISYMQKDKNSKTGFGHDTSLKVIGKLINTITKLKDHKTGSTLVKTCARKMYDRKFEESLDGNPYLIGFDNGVFDLRTMSFRNGEPDDRVAMSVGYDYIYKNKEPPKKIIKEINECIHKIQPEDDMRDYIMRYFASCLDGKNRDQSFRIFTGSGGNGKSVLVKLFELSLGEYYGILPAAVLTMRESGPNNASPFLADMKGKRAVAIHETEGDASIQLGKMKGLTGGDKITTRKNFGDPFSFVPMFKLMLICNKLPKIPSDDGGTWRRIRVSPFESKFVSADKVNESKHHYLRDTSLDDEKLGEWSQIFMWMLLNIYYPKYIATGLCEPAKVTIFSEKYQRDSDVLLDFLSQVTIETKEDKDSESVMDLFKQFKDWVRQTQSGKFDYSKHDFEEYLVEKRGLRIDNGKIFGIKSRFTEFDR
ncbi:D5 family helicase-primase [Bodo saltans virus]|uniref:D5 family helicase-primase n=1 Tax=Bodo saltans virus TaxID=2024608 RepID=A0A2H4UU01_9VIRU|nr:D5 family helicase-primase [Bodo saltans virus]ATZ80378.1 D5 family helicase-primase [Bodo saltans virus]